MNPVDLLLGLLGLAALIAPGWWLARHFQVSSPLLAGFSGGVVVMMNAVLVLDALGIPLALTTLATAWGASTAVAFAATAWHPRRGPSDPTAPVFAWSADWPLCLPLVPMTAVVIYRATAQPLFGVDTVFRWNFLAEQMLAHGSLAFYPPVTAAHYEIYAWPDGIAPAVSTLYFWLYALAGAARPTLTAPLVLGQFALLFMAVYALGRRWFSPRAGALASALFACSPIVAWATVMGQQTGLTELAFAGLLLYLPRTRDEETAAAIVAAGLAAALGALAREYGLALPLFGLALGITRRLSWRAVALFGVVAAAAVLPWYARNWMRTGNPLFDLGVGGWFPVNEVHAWLNACFQREFGWFSAPPEAAQLVLVNTIAGTLGLAAGVWLNFRRARGLLAAAALAIAIWAASVGYTAAGFIYSLRVLSPALVFGAVLGGSALARWVPARRHLVGVVVGLTLFATDAALRTLTLPANVYRLPPAQWLAAGRALHNYHQRPIYAELTRVAGRERLLVLGPNALLTNHGARTVPLWSPEVRFVFDPRLAPAEIIRRLRAAGFGFVLLNTGPANECFLAHSAFFRDPAGALATVWSDGDMVLLKVNDSRAP